MNAAAAWLCWPRGPLNDAPGSVRHVGDSTQTVCTYSRAKLSPFLRPLTIRQPGGTSPGAPFPFWKLQNIGQAKRDRPEAKPLWARAPEVWGCGQGEALSTCPCRRCSCPSGSIGKAVESSFQGGVRGGGLLLRPGVLVAIRPRAGGTGQARALHECRAQRG